jgi:soluble lytic murein transglycosylase
MCSTARAFARFVAVFVCASTCAHAAEGNLDRQRQDYLAALQAINADDVQRFDSLYRKLDGYVLQGYLRYEFLKDRLASTSEEDIRRFIERNDFAPISAQLRARWLNELAARGEWDTFMHEYRANDDPALQCLYLTRLLNASNNGKELAPKIGKLWLTDQRLPSVCNTIFGAAREHGYLTDELVWKRIELLMTHHQPSFAGELAKQYLDPDQRTWVRRWQEMYRNPAEELHKLSYAEELHKLSYKVDNARAGMIVKHGIVRLAHRNPQAAMAQWERLRGLYPLLAKDDGEIVGTLAMLATQRHSPMAVQWFAEVPDNVLDSDLRLWALRAALRESDWALGKRIVANLGKDEQTDRFWWYWTARIMEETGQSTKAEYLYALVAADRNYYSFLAADRLRTGYVMQHQAVKVNPQDIEAVLKQPGMQAARELYAVGDVATARTQWEWTTAGMNKQELEAAALVAGDWGWHDRAIVSLKRSGHFNDLDLRFPLVYRDIVETNAAEHDLDPSWVYGVIRQESGFAVDARSTAGALGLMQLMPRVGRSTARRLKLDVRGSDAILEVENNLRLGTAFLQNLLKRHSGNQLLATAAYNAGPGRVKSWRPHDGSLPADVWVETIPYEETRDYVKNVMAYATVYDYRLARAVTRLCMRMPPVTAPGAGDVSKPDCPQLPLATPADDSMRAPERPPS